ncbi:DUF1661 domain-containing protein [Porphyromonas gingivalis]|nr:DUF1661 domain-containing protein [Porphyromonas gingivalis]
MSFWFENKKKSRAKTKKISRHVLRSHTPQN